MNSLVKRLRLTPFMVERHNCISNTHRLKPRTPLLVVCNTKSVEQVSNNETAVYRTILCFAVRYRTVLHCTVPTCTYCTVPCHFPCHDRVEPDPRVSPHLTKSLRNKCQPSSHTPTKNAWGLVRTQHCCVLGTSLATLFLV